MKEYAVKIRSFTIRDIIENRELFDELRSRCEDLVGKTIYLNSLKRDITIEAWYSQDNIEDNSKDLILVFTCDKEMKEPEKVLPEVLNFENAAGESLTRV